MNSVRTSLQGQFGMGIEQKDLAMSVGQMDSLLDPLSLVLEREVFLSPLEQMCRDSRKGVSGIDRGRGLGGVSAARCRTAGAEPGHALPK